ncbi:MAG: hypothetical protein C4539_10050 [Ignavibacteriales bacterium]|nr:MAG: hypothetical protein C4539_10050 [Ignavibacteriales bacterium]
MKKTEILKAIEPVIKAFDELGISYYVGGSIASSAYGIARATMDVDFISNMNFFQIKPLVEKLKTEFFIDEFMISDSIKTSSSFNLIHLETMLKIDVFILKDISFHKTAFERKRKDTLILEDESIEIYLSSPEDIILNKLEWFRMGGEISERQWLDILGVIKVQGDNLDVKYLSNWAKELSLNDLLVKALKESEQ